MENTGRGDIMRITILLASALLVAAGSPESPSPPQQQEAQSSESSTPAATSETSATATANAESEPAADQPAEKKKKKKSKKELDPMTADLGDLAAAGYKIEKQEDGKELFCRRDRETGSRVVSKTVCYTRKELRDLSMRYREEMLKTTTSYGRGGN